MARNSSSTRDFDKTVGIRLRTFRNRRGLSQAQLARILGVSFQQLQKNETGRNRLTFHRAHQASEALGISLIELGGLNGSKIKLTSPIERIDFQMLEEFSGLDPKVKPDVLKMLRSMNKNSNKRK